MLTQQLFPILLQLYNFLKNTLLKIKIMFLK